MNILLGSQRTVRDANKIVLELPGQVLKMRVKV